MVLTAFQSSETLQKLRLWPSEASLGGWCLPHRNGPMCPSTVNSAKNSSLEASFCCDITLPKEMEKKKL